MIPVLIVGLLLKDQVNKLFAGDNFVFIGSMLIITAALLFFTYFFKKKKQRDINYLDAFIIGISQAIAVFPGISRSGVTIATGLINGNKKEEIAKFSFLMVLIPILGENFLDIIGGHASSSGIPISSLLIGFFAAFISGLFACTAMINLVKKGKLYWFAVYCILIGVITIFFVK